MDREAAKLTIANHAEELRALGVRSLSLFGSTARNEARAGSDIDMLVELDSSVPVGLLGLARIQQRIEEILGHGRVDLVIRDAVFDAIKEDIYSEAVPCLSASGSSE